MELTIKRNESNISKTFGGEKIVFSLFAKLNLNDEEKGFLEKYKSIMHYCTDNIGPTYSELGPPYSELGSSHSAGQDLPFFKNITINNLASGITIEEDTPNLLYKLEQFILKGCNNLLNIIDNYKNFNVNKTYTAEDIEKF